MAGKNSNSNRDDDKKSGTNSEQTASNGNAGNDHLLEVPKTEAAPAPVAGTDDSTESEKKTHTKPTILVVGDSFIDENWVMRKYELSKSYNVGDHHYISDCPNTNISTISFSGVLGMMKFLIGNIEPFETKQPQQTGSGHPTCLPNDFDLIGLSAFNPSDTQLLNRMLCPHFLNSNRINPYSSAGLVSFDRKDGLDTQLYCASCKDKPCGTSNSLFNVFADEISTTTREEGGNAARDAHQVSADKDPTNPKDGTSTNHIIRTYVKSDGSKLKLTSRSDWVLTMNQKWRASPESIAKSIQKNGHDVKAIVVVDHGYKTIDGSLIRGLIDNFPDALWYIRTKEANPEWLREFEPKPESPQPSKIPPSQLNPGSNESEESKPKSSQPPRIQLIITDQRHVEVNTGIRVWHHGGKYAGRATLEVIGSLLGLTTFEHTKEIPPKLNVRAENAAFLLDDGAAVAASRVGCAYIDGKSPPCFDDAAMFSLLDKMNEPFDSSVGRTTVFFASLVLWDLVCRPDAESTHSSSSDSRDFGRQLNKDTMYEAVKFARTNATNWARGFCGAIREHEGIGKAYSTAIYSNRVSTKSGQSRPNSQKVGLGSTDADPKCVTERESVDIEKGYLAQWNEWNQSSSNLGVVGIDVPKVDVFDGYNTSDATVKTTKNGRREDCEIQLWRAYGTLKEYICPGGKKRTDVNELVTRLDEYKNSKNRKHPFNCLLLGEPGWGKSHLAKRISKHYDFKYLTFSIAQMSSNRELIEAFKMVSSSQDLSDKQVLVFVDEVDALIESHHALGLMLGPIWDGKFTSEGNTYRIKPCIWFFASSTPLDELWGKPKGKDFLSRINGPIIQMGLPNESASSLSAKMAGSDAKKLHAFAGANGPGNQVFRTELVYHGLNFLNLIHGPIEEVSEGVLRVFYDTAPLEGVRSMEIFVSRFRNINRGRVTEENLPDLAKCPELERHIMILNQNTWKAKGTPLIKVNTKPEPE